MSVDLAALANAVVAGGSDVRACLIVSRDGLPLAACPESEEEKTLTVWSRIAALGEVDRGFVSLREEVWAFCRRGPYLALATASTGARPGLLLDRLEQLVLAAEEARVRKDAVRPPDREAPLPAPATDSSRGPRTSLHREAKEEEQAPPLEDTVVTAWAARLRALAEQSRSAAEPLAPTPRHDPSEGADAGPGSPPGPAADPGPRAGSGSPTGEGVDRVELSREFAGLLSERDQAAQEES